MYSVLNDVFLLGVCHCKKKYDLYELRHVTVALQLRLITRSLAPVADDVVCCCCCGSDALLCGSSFQDIRRGCGTVRIEDFGSMFIMCFGCS